MEDGQELGKFAPDRDEEDPIDLEFNGVVPPTDPTDEDESSEGSSNSEGPDDDDDGDDDAAADVGATEADTAV